MAVVRVSSFYFCNICLGFQVRNDFERRGPLGENFKDPSSVCREKKCSYVISWQDSDAKCKSSCHQ